MKNNIAKDQWLEAFCILYRDNLQMPEVVFQVRLISLCLQVEKSYLKLPLVEEHDSSLKQKNYIKKKITEVQMEREMKQDSGRN